MSEGNGVEPLTDSTHVPDKCRLEGFKLRLPECGRPALGSDQGGWQVHAFPTLAVRKWPIYS